MLTRAIAIERLRTTGTLATTERPKTAVNLDQLQDPIMKAVGRIMGPNQTARGVRHLAPTTNHVVLP